MMLKSEGQNREHARVSAQIKVPESRRLKECSILPYEGLRSNLMWMFLEGKEANKRLF